MRILFIEDDRDFRELVTEILCEDGHSVIEVECGEEAFRLLEQSEAFDAVIIDQGIPGLSGAEWVARARKDRRFQNLPILFMSGDLKTEEIASRLGLQYFLRKPPSLEELSKCVKAMSGLRDPHPDSIKEKEWNL